MKRKSVHAQRSAGERRSGKSPKIHHELQPIGSCSSTSSPHSRKQRMTRWTCEREIAYFDAARDVLGGMPWPKPKQGLHEAIAMKLNDDERFERVVTTKIVKDKYYSFKDQWKSKKSGPDRTLVTTRKKKTISGHESTFELLFDHDGAETSSGPVSLASGPTASLSVNGVDAVTSSNPSYCGGVRIGLNLTPEQESAVQYLSKGNGINGSMGKELLIFTEMLCNVDFLVQSFHLMPDDYVMRRASLIDVFQHGGKGVPDIPEHEIPEDFKKKSEDFQ